MRVLQGMLTVVWLLCLSMLVVACGEDDQRPDGWVVVDGDQEQSEVDFNFGDDDDDDTADGDVSDGDVVVPERYEDLVSAVRQEMPANDSRPWAIPGVAFGVIENGQLSFNHALGYKDAALTEALQPDTLFRIASVSKMMTAAGLLHEVDAGTVQLSQLITEFAPQFATADESPHAANLTLQHCLTMSSGLYDLIYIGWPGTCTESLVDFFNGGSYTSGELSLFMVQPGAMYNYSNPNYMLAGLALEQASGVPFGSYLEQNVFTPLGMTRTFFDPTKAQADGNTAKGRCSLDYCSYAYEGDPTSAPADWYTEVTPQSYNCAWGWPSAFGFSSVPDLARFAGFIMDGNLDVLSQASHEAMQSPQINTQMAGDMLSYGYGLLVQQGLYIGTQFYDITIIMHDGAMPGYSSSVYVVPELGFGFISLANTDYAQIFNAFVFALSRYADLPEASQGPDNSNDPALYPAYAGNYVDTLSGYTMTVQSNNEVLTASGPWVDAAFGVSQLTLDGTYYAKHNFLLGSLPITFIMEQNQARYIRNRFVVFERQDEKGAPRPVVKDFKPFTPQQQAQLRQDAHRLRRLSQGVMMR